MDKEYLIHNIKIEDNPDDQHKTLDIKLDNIRYDNNDWIANIELAGYANGEPVGVVSNEDVSLTGAGGGGVPVYNITIIPTFEGNPIEYNSQNLTLRCLTPDDDIYFAGNNEPSRIIKAAKVYNNDIIIFEIYLGGDDFYAWYSNSSDTPTITGSAEITSPDNHIRVYGDCTITVPFVLD